MTQEWLPWHLIIEIAGEPFFDALRVQILLFEINFPNSYKIEGYTARNRKLPDTGQLRRQE